MIFSALHILFTAAVTAVLVLAVGLWRLPRAGWLDAVAAGVLSGAAVALWRLSANMGPLTNDWAAPILVFVFLSVYADLRVPADAGRYRQVRALATLCALAVNVITI
jgi:hypothetical protein